MAIAGASRNPPCGGGDPSHMIGRI